LIGAKAFVFFGREPCRLGIIVRIESGLLRKFHLVKMEVNVLTDRAIWVVPRDQISLYLDGDIAEPLLGHCLHQGLRFRKVFGVRKPRRIELDRH
jgi:hypothetical protein